MQISVDRDFARFGAKSYAINKINTVEVREEHPYGLALVIIAGLICLGAIFAAIDSTPAEAGGPVGIAVIAGAVAVWAHKRTNIIDYKLYLVTSSSETQALTSRDGVMVNNLRNQIEDAMVGRVD